MTGYELVEFDLNERTSVATLTWERVIGGKIVETEITKRLDGVPPRSGADPDFEDLDREQWARAVIYSAKCSGRTVIDMIKDAMFYQLAAHAAGVYVH